MNILAMVTRKGRMIWEGAWEGKGGGKGRFL